MKKKVIIYGLGQAWEAQKDRIEHLFDVIGYSDKKVQDIDGFIKVGDIDSYNADYVYITSAKYCDEIEAELAFLCTKTISGWDILGYEGGEILQLVSQDSIDEILLRRKVTPLMGKRQYFPFFQKLYFWALEGMNIGTGSEAETSGEINVLDFVKKLDANPLVLFDVGANVGNYTKLLLKYIGGAGIDVVIHCFEVSKNTFKALEQNLCDDRVVLNNIGLSNERAEATLYCDKDNSGMASLYNRQLDYLGKKLSETEDVTLISLDEYCGEKGIKRIDFIKMDVEGNEFNVLKGAAGMLAEKRIKAIQFEFGGANLDSRTYFRDFWNLLTPQYSIYRILKDGLMPISQYHECLDIFSCTNYLAVLQAV